MSRGLLMIHTGRGKGKTTAALGLMFRALGHGFKVCMIQFIKGKWRPGEMAARERFRDLLDWHVTGRGFTWKSDDPARDALEAGQAWASAKEIIASGRYDMVVLDEFTYLVTYRMIDEEDVVDFFASRPPHVHVVLTGRDAPASLVEMADLVTEMNDLKHHYGSGVKAQKGIEF